MKFKKAISVSAAVATCCTTILGFSASAREAADIYESTSIVADMNAADPAWTESMRLAGGRYRSAYIKILKKYHGKSSKTTVRYGDSRIKGFIDRLKKAATADEPNALFCMASSTHINCEAVKGDKIKIIEYINSGVVSFWGIYSDPETDVTVSPKYKMKNTSKHSDGDGGYRVGFDEEDSIYNDLGITDDTKGNVFKIKYNNETYVYEEFNGENYHTLGMLFDPSGDPVGLVDAGYYCVTFSTSLKDSDFTVPSDYVETDIDDIPDY